ncbi:ATP-binding protein [Tolypothrix sp. VBCCA 56010]|uniref:ATP-binding protein n=1 Tax=Tolypothrix sp. VBCCA 56010 TaxID=3137731 RepID=UPI003D7DEA09
MKRNLIELVAAGVFGVAAIAGFATSQSRQPYDLTQIQFCPASKTEKGQIYLDRTYCNHRHYVLTEAWRRYGGYDSVIPYKGDAIQWVRDLPTDNPRQLEASAVAVVGLWGVAGCLIVRSQRLKRTDYEKSEAEKTEGYNVWLIDAHRREVKQHSTQLHTERLKDGLTAMDMEERKTLGLTDEENENAKARIQFEDFMKARAVSHSAQDKTIAENLLAKAKADKERAKTEGQVKEPEQAVTTATSNFTLPDEYKWINQLLKLPFRVLSGEQGSGKSTLERLMIRLLKDEGYHVVVINPETNPAVWSGVEVLVDAEDIDAFMGAFPGDIRARQGRARERLIDEDDFLTTLKDEQGLNGRVAIFLMESNTYEVHGVSPDLLAAFLKQSLTNIRKWGYTVCLTAHSDNQTSVSSALSGFSKLLDSQPRVDCIAIADPQTNEAVSSGKAWLKMKGVKDPQPLEVPLYNYPKTKQF